MICSGDNYGRLRLHRYPATQSSAGSQCYRSHGCSVTRLAFANGDTFLISLGGADKCIYVWKHLRDREGMVAHDMQLRATEIAEEDDDIIDFFGQDVIAPTEPVDFDASRLTRTAPWLAAALEPSRPPALSSDPPECKLQLLHVFGVQSRLSRNSVRYNATGDILCPASRLVSVYCKKDNKLSIFAEHTATVCCVATTDDGQFAASAARSPRCEMMVWDGVTAELLCTLPPLHRHGVSSMRFSPDKQQLVRVNVCAHC